MKLSVTLPGCETFLSQGLRIYNTTPKNNVGRDSSVSIATRYGLDRPGIESRCGRDFPHPSRPVLRPTLPPVQWVTGVSRG